MSFTADTGIGGSTLYDRACTWIPNTPFSVAHGARGALGRQLMSRHGPLGVDCSGKSRLQFDIAGNVIGFGKRSADRANLDEEDMKSKLYLLFPTAEEMDAMDDAMQQERQAITARQILEIVDDDLEKLQWVETAVTLDEFPSADVNSLCFMIEATELAGIILTPSDTKAVPANMAGGVLAKLVPESVDGPAAEVPDRVDEPATEEALEPRLLHEHKTRDGLHVQIFESTVHEFQRPTTPVATVNTAHLQKSTSDGRNLGEYIMHVTTETNIVYDSLSAIATANVNNS